ncbi:hypothetical protein V8J88_04595 [Massilia sp. W12]|uniref:pilus assembly PilX family protein n=1 Tax=Massilia sp. W12 TaxID=3126507 RepID=UPI0030D20560
MQAIPDKRPVQQSGVVLLITLIMLVAMTLGGVALVRSVHITTMIAGNLAFQQATLLSATLGQETAVNWLQQNGGTVVLDNNDFSRGYSATLRTPPNGTSWSAYWDNTLRPAGVVSLGEDSTGNTIEYVIDRVCTSTGASPGCALPDLMQDSTEQRAGSSRRGGDAKPSFTGSKYYRILTRVQGPRSTASFVETMVML